MNTFIADPSLQQSLSMLPGLTQVRDADGVVLGYFTPASQNLADAYTVAAAHFDPAELQSRKSSGKKGSTTSEVLNRITAPRE